MIGAHESLNPILNNDKFELLVIEIVVGGKYVRVITGYGPQETWKVEDKMPFFLALKEEVSKAEIAGRSILIGFDANSKLGPDWIKHDKNEQSQNGKVLEGIIQRHALIVANYYYELYFNLTNITRQRNTIDGVEESAIDYIILSQDMESAFMSLYIDETKKFSLTSCARTKKGTIIKESDHNTLLCKFNFTFNPHIKNHKIEIFNFNDKEGINKFKYLTSVNNKLSQIFLNISDLNTATKKFLKTLKRICHQSFKKIRIKENQNQDIIDLFDKRRILRSKDDVQSKTELKNIEEELATKCAEQNYLKIKTEMDNIQCDEGGFNAGKFWNLKKKLCPRPQDPVTAMLDDDGNLVTTVKGIQNLAIKHYTNVLRNRTISEKYSKLKDDKEDLCEERVKLARENKSPPWNIDDLEAVLKFLKNKKARDPYGLINELFKPNVAGGDLKAALLVMMNRIKDEQTFPEQLEHCTLSSIFKRGKVVKNNFNNYRGIFRVNIFRSILDRLIYNDYYEQIDEFLTDCNVGGRRGRNIRDNLFVLNAITNNVNKGSCESCDIAAYYAEKCFDALWAQECVNDLWDAGCRDDKLALLHLENKRAQVAIKSSGEKSEPVNI